jgi:hypothetical protein
MAGRVVPPYERIVTSASVLQHNLKTAAEIPEKVLTYGCAELIVKINRIDRNHRITV